MKKEIGPFRIEIPMGVMFQSVNCYLVPGDQLTLIDCGLYADDNWDILQQRIIAHGYQVSDIEQVIITHEHQDHIGLLPEILEHSKAIIKAPKAISEWFVNPKAIQEKENLFAQKLIQTLGFPIDVLSHSFDLMEHSPEIRAIKELDRIQYFNSGDFLHIANEEWEVLNTAGHCPTQFVFCNHQQSRIFGSDMLLPLAPMPIVVEDPGNDGNPVRALAELLNSFERLKTYAFQTVYPGHGEIFQNANENIKKQIARIKVRKDECCEAIKSGLNTPYLVNRKMYPYQQMPPDFSGLHMVLGYIDLLIEEGAVKKEYNDAGELQLY